MTRRVCLAGMVCLLGLLVGLGHAEDRRSLPFSKQSVFNYFRQVEDARRDIQENLKPEAFQERMCRLYADVLRHSGYDFEATVLSALSFAEKGANRLDDPRFMFLAGVFKEHPDYFVQLKLISKTTRDAVVRYFGG